MARVGLGAAPALLPRRKVPPETSLVNSGRRLSSAWMDSDSVPVCSMMTSPTPVSSTVEKPDTSRDSVRRVPEPVVPIPGMPEQAPTRSPRIPAPRPFRLSVNALLPGLGVMDGFLVLAAADGWFIAHLSDAWVRHMCWPRLRCQHSGGRTRPY